MTPSQPSSRPSLLPDLPGDDQFVIDHAITRDQLRHRLHDVQRQLAHIARLDQELSGG